MKNIRRFFIAIVLLLSVFLSGCGLMANSGPKGSQKGYLILKVNPEVQIEYNQEAIVTDVEGLNDDGKELVENYNKYIGKDSSKVLSELVEKIYEEGYLDQENPNDSKQIILELEPGSVIPGDDFLLDLTVSVEEAVKGMNIKAVDVKAKKISGKDALGLAAQDAGFDLSEVKVTKQEEGVKEDLAIHLIEFEADGKLFSYEIDLESGDIINKTSPQELAQETDDKSTDKQNDDRTAEKQDRSSSQEKASSQEPAQQDQNTAPKQSGQEQSSPSNSNSGQAPSSKANQQATAKPSPAAKGKASQPAPKASQPAAKPSPPPAKASPPPKPARISQQQAVQIAINRAGTSGDIDVEFDDGYWEVEIEAGNYEYEIEIDVYGNIISFEAEYDD